MTAPNDEQKKKTSKFTNDMNYDKIVKKRLLAGKEAVWPRGSINKAKAMTSRDFALEWLFTDPSTGKRLSFNQVATRVSKLAEKYPSLMQDALNRVFGKVQDQAPVQLQQINMVFQSEKGKEFIRKLKAGEFKKTIKAQVETTDKEGGGM